MPSGSRFIRGAAKAGKKILRSAERLIGHDIFEDGRIVEDVVKPKKGWRKIIFNDGSHQMRTKQEINDLCRSVGDKAYQSKFLRSNIDNQREMALRSLKFHYNRNPRVTGSPFTADTMERMTRQHLQRLGGMQTSRPDLEWVRTTEFGRQQLGNHVQFPMPKRYIDILEDMDLIERVERRTKRLK